MIEYIGRNLLHKLPAETAHDLSLKYFSSSISSLTKQKLIKKPVKLLGLEFPNPIGLAAGFDKDAMAGNGLDQLGFGFLEFGTVTPKPQFGNPKPRLFRSAKNKAIINRMGFNNAGVDNLVRNLQNKKFQSSIGINIGKNKDTPNEEAIDDYSLCLKKVYSIADYITVNISSPNTQDLRKLQETETLKLFLNQLKELQLELSNTHKKYTPILVKIAPDQDSVTSQEIGQCIKDSELDGIICTNTTISRDNLLDDTFINEQGGLSGAPLLNVSNQVLKSIRNQVGDDFPIIGVGGILTAEDALSKIDAGANLVQIYSGLIYKGPKIIQDIINKL